MFELSKIDMCTVEKLSSSSYDMFVELGKFADVSNTVITIDRDTITRFISEFKSDLSIFNRYICNKLHEADDSLKYVWVEDLLERYKNLLIELNIFENHYEYGLSTVTRDIVSLADFYMLMMKLYNNAIGIGNGVKGHKLAGFRWKHIEEELGLTNK